jgi:hypothetical protein
MKSSILACAALLALASAGAGAASRAAAYSEETDPPRWYEPADTPQKKYETAMKEARNALADALKECKSSKPCEAEARARYEKEAAEAKAHLAPNRQLG